MSRFFYLASPFAKYPDGKDAALAEVAKHTANFLLSGVTVYSPIVHCSALVKAGLIPAENDNWAFWSLPDEDLLRSSCGLIVCMMEGWARSVGVGEEIKWATGAGLPVHHFCPINDTYGSYATPRLEFLQGLHAPSHRGPR